MAQRFTTTSLLTIAALIVAVVALVIALRTDRAPMSDTEPTTSTLQEGIEDGPALMGWSEAEGYYTTVTRYSTLDQSGPADTCAAFAVQAGPEALMNAIEERGADGNIFLLGDADTFSSTDITSSSEAAPVQVRIDFSSNVMESSIVGCETYPLEQIRAL